MTSTRLLSRNKVDGKVSLTADFLFRTLCLSSAYCRFEFSGVDYRLNCVDELFCCVECADITFLWWGTVAAEIKVPPSGFQGLSIVPSF